MANEAKAHAVAKTAAQSARGNPHWEYTQKDCQAWVEWCWAQNGYKVNYAGSNDMFRNACTWLGTKEEATAQGKLLPGALVFTLKDDGKEPDKYKKDGIGNAAHVGIYCGVDGVEVGHSTTGGSQADSISSRRWTHVGLAKGVAYDGAEPIPPPSGERVVVDTSHAPIPNGTLTLRKEPSPMGGAIAPIPNGTRLPLLYREGKYAKVRYGIHKGYVLAAYTKPLGDAEPEDKVCRVIVEKYKAQSLSAAQADTLLEALGAMAYEARREEV